MLFPKWILHLLKGLLQAWLYAVPLHTDFVFHQQQWQAPTPLYSSRDTSAADGLEVVKITSSFSFLSDFVFFLAGSLGSLDAA